MVLILGDLGLDVYWKVKENRKNPESEARLVNLESIEYCLGCAANVSKGLKRLGAQVELMGRIGIDNNSHILTQLVAQEKIKSSLRIYNDYRIPEKIRITTDQYLLRVDNEQIAEITEEQENSFFAAVKSSIDKYKVLVLSDYGKGLLTERLCQLVIGLARENGVFVITDPKKNGLNKYFNSNLITPNQNEASILSGKKQLKAMARYLCDHSEYVLVTMAAYGMNLYQDGELLEHYPALNHDNVRSVCGAGDGVISGIAYFISQGKSVQEAVRLTNPLVAEALTQKGTITHGLV